MDKQTSKQASTQEANLQTHRNKQTYNHASNPTIKLSIALHQNSI